MAEGEPDSSVIGRIVGVSKIQELGSPLAANRRLYWYASLGMAISAIFTFALIYLTTQDIHNFSFIVVLIAVLTLAMSLFALLSFARFMQRLLK